MDNYNNKNQCRNGLQPSSYLNAKLTAALTIRFPKLKQYQAEKCINKYVSVMLREIASSISSFNITDDQVSLPLAQIRDEVGRVSIGGKKQWIVPLLHTNPGTSLVTIDFRGNEGKNSRVSFNPMYQKDIYDELINLNYELNTKRIDTLKQVANVVLQVNIDTLNSFIKKTQQTYEVKAANSSKAYLDTLTRNLQIANQLRDSIYEEDGVHYLAEYWEESDSGRSYGHGLSLQRIPKEIRHAALGRCHKYDFMASSYALMTGIAQSINQALKVADIVLHIKNRSNIRKSIADEIGISEAWMKDIFTSLGFGASTANNPFTSIRGKLGAEKYAALMANKQFRNIKERMDEVRKTIAAHFPDEFEFMGRKYNSIDPRTLKKRTNNQKLAWIYQVMESDAVTYFGQRAAENGQGPIMFAHDCLYFKNKLPQSLMDDIMYELNKTYPLLKAEHEAIYPIHADGYVDPVKAEYAKYDAMVAEHKALIWKQEQAEKQKQTTCEADQLDPMNCYFADMIKALNPHMSQSLGTEISFSFSA